ncbi:hypothetical protein JCM6882_007347 [Rhodosporidiobolus microsporus]
MSTPALSADLTPSTTLSRSASPSNTAPSSTTQPDALKDSSAMDLDTPQPAYADYVPSSVPSEDERAAPSTSTSESAAALAQGAVKPLSPLKQQQETVNGTGLSTAAPGKRPASAEPEEDEQETITVSDASKPAAGPAKKKRKSEAKADTVYCHQDHQPHDVKTTLYLRCTGEKPVGKNKTIKPCNILYCERCLTNRYGEDVKALKESGEATSWTCPSCRGICNCSTCRKKQGLDATGALKQLAKDQGVSNANDLLSVLPSARSAAQKAASRLSATFTAGGKMAAQSLTKDSPPPEGGKKKKSASKKKGKKAANGDDDDGGAGSVSSLSSLTDSEEEDEEKTGGAKGKGKGKGKKQVKGAADGATPSAAAAKGKGKGKATSPSGDGDEATPKPKKIFPPRAPPKLLSPPTTYPLSSTSYPHAVLPLSDSLLARLNLREFLLRFLHLIPSLRTGGKVAPKAAHARALSSLSDDVLWLWSDGDFAAETMQLTVLAALVEFLLSDKANSGAMWPYQRAALKRVRDEVRAAKESGNGRVRDKPWETVAREVVERGCEWVGRGREWARGWGEKAGVEVDVGKAVVMSDDEEEEEEGEGEGEGKKGKEEKPTGRPPPTPEGKAKGKGRAKVQANGDGGGEDSDLSDLSGGSDGEGESDDEEEAKDADSDEHEDEEMSSPPPARKNRRAVANSDDDEFSDPGSADEDDDDEDDDEEVDMLASDYDEEAEQRKQELRKAWRGKFERDTPAEERLALCLALVDMLMYCEHMRGDMAAGTDAAYTQRVDLNKKRFQLRRDLVDEKARIAATKTDRPPGNEASEKVKEWREAMEKVEVDLANADITNKKEGWHVQHDLYLCAHKHQTRFVPLGTDVLGNVYYSFLPPPRKLLENPTAAATSGFPVHRSAADDAAGKDYPLSYCIVVHGKRPLDSTPKDDSPRTSPSKDGSPPLAERAAAAKAKSATAAAKKGDKDVPGAQSVLDALDATAVDGGADDWWVVRGVDDLDALADWLESTQRHATFEHAFAVHHLEHTPVALGANKSHKTKKEIEALKALIPTKKEVERRRVREQRGDEGIVDAVRQFAAYVRWTRERAVEQAEGGGGGRVLRKH